MTVRTLLAAIVIGCLVATLSLAPALAGDAIPKDLVGKWRATGETPPDPQGRRMGWFAEYDVRPDGTFVMTGYPPISVNGKIAVLGRDKGRVHLRLTERKMSGSAWPDLDEWAELSADGRTLRFDKKTFTRQP